jgi:tellurite resistance protein TerB
MAERYIHSSPTTALNTGYLSNRDEEVMQALVTAGAFVVLADSRVDAIEPDELVNCIDRQEFVPTISQNNIAEAFDNRVRQLGDRDTANVIVETFQPLAGPSLASVVVRTAERVAAADRQIYAGELRVLKLIRLIMVTLPVTRCAPSQHDDDARTRNARWELDRSDAGAHE